MSNDLRSPGRRHALLVLVVGAALAAPLVATRAGEAAAVIPAPAAGIDATAASTATSETAVFAGGCFWGVQGVFQHVSGVTRAVSGYAGGSAATARYGAVGTGATGHAEAVRVTYDPRRVSYGQLLQVYFSVAHDPTQRNRQGPDVGPQYRSTVFAQSPAQARTAADYIAQLDRARVYAKPIATTIESDKAFYEAEAYHQDYMTLNPRQPYIVVHDLPKVENLRRLFPSLYRTEPVLVGSSR